jgi:N-acetylmuramoyl-L-alanine amidase
MAEIAEFPSPSFDARPEGQGIDILLLHYTGMKSAQAAIGRLCDPQAKVSAHYLIHEDGSVLRLVAEEKRAWHAGQSRWQGADDINGRSIGIELVNPGHEFGYRPFARAQMAALIDLASGIVRRHAIAPARVLGHSDVAPLRKQDPGELFDWRALAEAGVGLWPEARRGSWSADGFLEDLRRYGYDLDGGQPGGPEAARAAAIIAFCRHFRPQRLTAWPDDDLAAILNGLIDVAGLRT